ncbi:MAG: DsbA family protein [Chthoniobacterales bacterium]
MKRYLPFIIVVAVGLATVVSGTVLYRQHQPKPLTIPAELKLDAAGDKTAHMRGAANPRVTIEEFGDFQCPPCGTLAGPLKQIEEENRNTVRVVFRNFPLVTHAHAREAAQAAEAAGLQERFWDMHDLLYREQANWSKVANAREVFQTYARMIGLDVERFAKDFDSPAIKARIDQDQKRGSSLGVENTPSLFMNNEPVPPPSLNPATLHKVVHDAVAKTAAAGRK